MRELLQRTRFPARSLKANWRLHSMGGRSTATDDDDDGEREGGRSVRSANTQQGFRRQFISIISCTLTLSLLPFIRGEVRRKRGKRGEWMDGRKKRRKKAGESRLRRRRCQSAKYRRTTEDMNKISQKEGRFCFRCRKKYRRHVAKTFRGTNALSRARLRRLNKRLQSHERRKEFGGGRREKGRRGERARREGTFA